jgi:uncharacterized protein (DUF4415 family)
MTKDNIKESLVEYADAELDAVEDRTDEPRVNAITDEELDASSEDTPLTEAQLDQFEPVMYIDGKEIKIAPIEPDILEWFKKGNDDYFSQINAALRTHIENHERNTPYPPSS